MTERFQRLCVLPAVGPTALQDLLFRPVFVLVHRALLPLGLGCKVCVRYAHGLNTQQDEGGGLGASMT